MERAAIAQPRTRHHLHHTSKSPEAELLVPDCRIKSTLAEG